MKKKDVEDVHLILWKQFLNKLIYIMEIMPLRSQEFLDFGQVLCSIFLIMIKFYKMKLFQFFKIKRIKIKILISSIKKLFKRKSN